MYPFGMQMPSRNYSTDKYRYGFNGKEKDKDLNSLTAYDYGFRIYNPAIGKFLSVDPLMDSYPWYSPYHYAGGNPIKNIDLDGAEPLDYVYKWVGTKMLINDKRRVDNEVERDDYLGVYSYSAVYDNVTEKHWFIMKKSGDPTFYYWKHKDGADPNRLIQSTSGKQDNGIWAPFKTRGQIDAEQGAAIARGMSTFFVAVFTAPFAYIGASGLVSSVSASVQALTVKTVTFIYSSYWKNAAWIGALGRTLAEFIDESGSIGASNTGANYFLEKSVQKLGEWLYSTFKFIGKSGLARTMEFGGPMRKEGKDLIIDAAMYIKGLNNDQAKGELGREGLNALKKELQCNPPTNPLKVR